MRTLPPTTIHVGDCIARRLSPADEQRDRPTFTVRPRRRALREVLQPFQHKLTPGNSQHTWLVNDLAATTKPWKIIITHLPPQFSRTAATTQM